MTKKVIKNRLLPVPDKGDISSLRIMVAELSRAFAEYGQRLNDMAPRDGSEGVLVFDAAQTFDGRDLSVDGAKLDGIEVGADVTDAVNVGAIVANKNLIINGNFNIWQRGTSFAAVANNDYTADRFEWNKVGSGVVTITKDTDTPNEYSESSLKVDTTTASGTPAAGDFYFINYKAEGLDTIPLAFGTTDARTVTISFWVKGTKTGIHSVALRNSAVNRAYVAEYTINTTNTWEKKTITIAGDTTGTWLRDNGIGLRISFTLASSSTFYTTPGSWQAGSFIATTNQVNALDNTANNFLLSQVKLEIGSVATDFVDRPHGEELALCQTYYEKSYDIGVDPGSVNSVGITAWQHTGSGDAVCTAQFKVKKRAIPTITIYSDVTGTADRVRNRDTSADVVSSARYIGEHAFTPGASAPLGTADQISCHYTADAEL